jgi:uncharacterized membrane protein YraQ (UPF0718 family)
MDLKDERKRMLAVAVVFAACYLLPVGVPRFDHAVGEALALAKWYAREHVLLGMLPAFFIAGAIRAFVRRGAVVKYLGPGARPALAYGVAAVSGAVLTVCSCTVLPLFAGIYKAGAGLGPACAFLYSGPAINVTAAIITARVLGVELGVVRAAGAVLFSLLIGAGMWALFRREPAQAGASQEVFEQADESRRAGWQTGLFFAALIAILVAANWSDSGSCACHDGAVPITELGANWWAVALLSASLGAMLVRWFGLALWRVLAAGFCAAAVGALTQRPVAAFTAGALGLWAACSTDEGGPGSWARATWDSAAQTLPLLLVGILVSGFLLGQPGAEGVVPSAWVEQAVGGNSLRAVLCSAASSALMYFSTCTEVPVLRSLMDAGMGRGPVLALMLAGPALSLPGMLLIHRVLGLRKTAAFVLLVVAFATLTGWAYGRLAG